MYERTNVVYACKYSYMHTLVLHVHMHSCSFIQDPATAVQSTDLGLLVLQAQQLRTLWISNSKQTCWWKFGVYIPDTGDEFLNN